MNAIPSSDGVAASFQFGSRATATTSNAFCFTVSSAATKSTAGQFSIFRKLIRTYIFHSIDSCQFSLNIFQTVRTVRFDWNRQLDTVCPEYLVNINYYTFEIDYFYEFYSVSRMSSFWKAASGSSRLVQRTFHSTTYIFWQTYCSNIALLSFESNNISK